MSARPPADFAQWLRCWRQACDLLPKELAQLAECSEAMIRSIERRARRPRADLAERLAAALGVPPAGCRVVGACAEGRLPLDRLSLPMPVVDGQAAPFRPPTQRSLLPPLIGRDAEVRTIHQLLLDRDARLLTLVGPDGVGKTHLARAAAASLRASFHHDVWFVDLELVGDTALVAEAVAAALNIPGARGRPIDRLVEAVRYWRALLVLDDCENDSATVAVIQEVLTEAPMLKVLATSRAPLRLKIEKWLTVRPLAVPDPARTGSLAEVVRAPAVVLFQERARAVQPHFEVGRENAAHVAALCQRLDGWPLAIELAAARMAIEDPAAILATLDSSSLHAVIESSYERLPPAAQRLLARLSVAPAGWTLQSAVAVCADPGDNEPAVAAELERLTGRSLLWMDLDTAGRARFRMSEVVRAYAAERLAGSDEAGLLASRFGRHVLALARRIDASLTGPDSSAHLSELRDEQANVGAVLTWACRAGDSALALDLTGALWRAWQVSGRFHEGRDWLERALARAGAEATPARAQALLGAGALAWKQGDSVQARACWEEALPIWAALGEAGGHAMTLKHLGLLDLYGGEPDRARERFSAALAERRRLDDQDGVASSLNDLAMALQDTGDLTGARALLEEARTACERQHHPFGLAVVTVNLGSVLLESGEIEAARQAFVQSLRLSRDLDSREQIVFGLVGLAAIATHDAKPTLAARLYAAADALASEIGFAASPSDRARQERAQHVARASVDEATWADAWAAGWTLVVERAVAAALGEEATEHHA
ncbi:MAG: tetratricopeptide repeat protein [Chloroflexi bacterium]|nr:tetratricopeptide repeat protein [Chloroflexota bacterium]